MSAEYVNMSSNCLLLFALVLLPNDPKYNKYNPVVKCLTPVWGQSDISGFAMLYVYMCGVIPAIKLQIVKGQFQSIWDTLYRVSRE